jgi:UDP-N-acetylmuramate dehydrogenase
MSPRIDWQQDVDLRALNTLGVSARARRLARCHSDTELLQALTECADDPEPPLVLGGGSNVLLVGDPQMAIIQPSLRGLRFREGSGGDVHVYAAAGESWDGLVRACCDRGLWGLENLALIPGHVGAAPVQNIGAYGVELSESLRAVEAIDRRSLRRERLPADALGFGYRDSLFKREPGRWLILGVELALSRDASPRTVYAGLAEALAEVPSPTPAQVAAVVSCIRRSKLPDPAQI